MQSTIREHRDHGQAGGIFNAYNIIKVIKCSLCLRVLSFEGPANARNKLASSCDEE